MQFDSCLAPGNNHQGAELLTVANNTDISLDFLRARGSSPLQSSTPIGGWRPSDAAR